MLPPSVMGQWGTPLATSKTSSIINRPNRPEPPMLNPLRQPTLSDDESICRIWTSEPEGFVLNRIHQMSGLKT